MTAGEVMRELLLAASGFAMGVLFILGALSFWKAVQGPKRVGHTALGLARMGSIVVILLVTQLIYNSLEIPPTHAAIEYLTGMTLVAMGYLIAMLTGVVAE